MIVAGLPFILAEAVAIGGQTFRLSDFFLAPFCVGYRMDQETSRLKTSRFPRPALSRMVKLTVNANTTTLLTGAPCLTLPEKRPDC